MGSDVLMITALPNRSERVLVHLSIKPSARELQAEHGETYPEERDMHLTSPNRSRQEGHEEFFRLLRYFLMHGLAFLDQWVLGCCIGHSPQGL